MQNVTNRCPASLLACIPDRVLVIVRGQRFLYHPPDTILDMVAARRARLPYLTGSARRDVINEVRGMLYDCEARRSLSVGAHLRALGGAL